MKPEEPKRHYVRGIAFAGFLTSQPELAGQAGARLAEQVGAPKLTSTPIPFTQSSYYEKEMGAGLVRTWTAFEQEFSQEGLADLKHRAAAAETEFRGPSGGRMINIDPGLVTLHNVLLTTHKPAGHRIYVGAGVFVEVTLLYQRGGFEPLVWTYPDYRTEAALAFFRQVRDALKQSMRSGEGDV